MEHSDIPSVIGHLLEELSWSGERIDPVRGSGRDKENSRVCQLAQELTLTHQDAAGKKPALMLILKTPPPIHIRGQGRFEIQAAIEADLIQAVSDDVRRQLICSQITETVLWITRSEIASAVSGSLQDFRIDDTSIHACVTRLAGALPSAIKWHGGKT
jgi:hypothetical protein